MILQSLNQSLKQELNQKVGYEKHDHIYIPGFGERSYFVLLHVTPYNSGAVFREPWDCNGPKGY